MYLSVYEQSPLVGNICAEKRKNAYIQSSLDTDKFFWPHALFARSFLVLCSSCRIMCLAANARHHSVRLMSAAVCAFLAKRVHVVIEFFGKRAAGEHFS